MLSGAGVEANRGPFDARCAPGAVERGRSAALPVAAAAGGTWLPRFAGVPVARRGAALVAVAVRGAAASASRARRRARPWRRSGAARCSMRTGRGRTRPWRRSAGPRRLPVVPGYLGSPAPLWVAVAVPRGAAASASRARRRRGRGDDPGAARCSMRTGRGRTRPWRRSAGRGGGRWYLATSVRRRRSGSRSRFHVERLPALRGRGAGAAVETIRGRSMLDAHRARSNAAVRIEHRAAPDRLHGRAGAAPAKRWQPLHVEPRPRPRAAPANRGSQVPPAAAAIPGYLGSPAFPWRAVARLWSRARRRRGLRGRGAGAAVETIRGPLDARMRTGRGRTRPWRRSAGRRRLPVVPGYPGSPAFSVAPWRGLWSRSRFHVERLPALRGRGAGRRPWRRSGGPLDARCAPGAVERGRGAALPVGGGGRWYLATSVRGRRSGSRSRSVERRSALRGRGAGRRPWRRSGAARCSMRTGAAAERGRGAALPVRGGGRGRQSGATAAFDRGRRIEHRAAPVRLHAGPRIVSTAAARRRAREALTAAPRGTAPATQSGAREPR